MARNIARGYLESFARAGLDNNNLLGYINMYVVKYYRRPNGQEPVAELRSSLKKHDKAIVDAKLEKLRECGLELLRTNMLKVIKGEDGTLYELVAGDFRVAIYFHRHENCFILINGWMKKGRKSPADISFTRQLLREYLG